MGQRDAERLHRSRQASSGKSDVVFAVIILIIESERWGK